MAGGRAYPATAEQSLVELAGHDLARRIAIAFSHRAPDPKWAADQVQKGEQEGAEVCHAE
ncbi:hypothetical protein ACRS6B_09595 [Nocardia asteroides]